MLQIEGTEGQKQHPACGLSVGMEGRLQGESPGWKQNLRPVSVFMSLALGHHFGFHGGPLGLLQCWLPRAHGLRASGVLLPVPFLFLLT